MVLTDGATDIGPQEDAGVVLDSGPGDGAVVDGALADAGETDATLDAGLSDGGRADSGEADGGASVDGGVSELEAALVVAWGACAATCPQYPLCAPDTVSIEECESTCDSDRASITRFAETNPDGALTCADAHAALSECLAAAACEDFLEFFLQEDPDFNPCGIQQSARTSACE